AFALTAETEVFELRDDGEGEAVVNLAEVHVRRADARALPEPRGDVARAHRRILRAVAALVGGRPRGVADAGDDLHRMLLQVAGALQAGDDAGRAAIGLQAAVEQAEGRGHQPRVQIVLHRERLLHQRARVLAGVLAAGDRHGAKLLLGGAVLVHVALRPEGEALWRGEQAERRREVRTGVAVRARREAVDRVQAEDGAGQAGLY